MLTTMTESGWGDRVAGVPGVALAARIQTLVSGIAMV